MPECDNDGEGRIKVDFQFSNISEKKKVMNDNYISQVDHYNHAVRYEPVTMIPILQIIKLRHRVRVTCKRPHDCSVAQQGYQVHIVHVRRDDIKLFKMLELENHM